MALFGFGRKKEKEIEELEKELGLGRGIGEGPTGLPKDDFGLEPAKEPERPLFKEEEFQVREIPRQEPQQTHVKDLELISAKLDSIRLMIDNMNERIKHIEHMEEEDAKKKKTW